MAPKKAPHQNLVETGASEAVDDNLLSMAVGTWNVLVEWQGTGKPVCSVEQAEGHTLIHVDLPEGPLGEYHISIQQPFIDIYRSWAGSMDCWRGSELTSIALNYHFDTAGNKHLPVICNYSRQGENRSVVGMLDHVPVTRINQRPILGEAPMHLLQTRFSRKRKTGGFRETLVVSTEKVHFAEAIKRFMTFCRIRHNIQPLPAPDWAREPVWCSWYSHLYVLTQQDVEEQIGHLKNLGIRTVLIDASWFHTPNLGLRMGAGDYEVEKSFFPDLRALSRRIHAEGLRIMLWCAPFFMGKCVRCRDAMAPYCVWTGALRDQLLCPFCRESRQHAYDTAARLMRDYELDGLKFDFMDTISNCVDPEHDHGDGNYGAAAIEFMQAARDGVLSVNPDAAIEYRISYSTLATLPLANCHRGNDAPYDADYIRRENLFLRLFCEYPSAVWNDYAYWHPDEKPENVALMLGEQVFSGGVPTLSLNFAQMSEEHRAITRRWMTFYAEHLDTLAKATLTVHSADSFFSISSLQNEEKATAYVLVAGQHIPARITLAPTIKEAWVLNASAENSGTMELAAGEAMQRVDLDGLGPLRVTL